MKPYLIFSLLLVYMLAEAQKPIQQKPIKTINQKFTSNIQNKSTNETENIRNLLNLNKDISLVRIDTIDNYKKINKTDNIKYGIEHQRYVQYFKGYKIEDSDIRVHKIGNTITQINGHITKLENFDKRPKINPNEAKIKAVNYFNAEYPEQPLKLTFSKTNSNELVLTSNFFDENDPSLHLAYKILVENKEPSICEYVYVDAENGEIINIENNILNVLGTGQTRYSGTKEIDATRVLDANLIDSCYILSGSFGNIISIQTINMLNIIDNLYNTEPFKDNDNNWTRSEMHLDDAALDVHWAMKKTCEYFYNAHGRMHYNGYGGLITCGIHNGLGKRTNYNTYYDYFSFGDGVTDNISGTPDYNVMVSLDFVAHEFGHAFCAKTANLMFIKETGAIQEGLSDIWAVCVENYAAPEKQKWLLGEEVLISVYNCERDLRYPKNRYLPDTYLGQYWMSTDGCKPMPDINDNCFVHKNCGVLNRWFYLLTEGGSGVNDIQNSYAVSGIGIEKAAQIVYLAETCYMTKYATYSSVRENMIDAATDIFGECSPEVLSVIEAWYAVGVGGITSMTLSDRTISEDTVVNSCSVEINNIHLTEDAKLEISAQKGIIFSGENTFDNGTKLSIE